MAMQSSTSSAASLYGATALCAALGSPLVILNLHFFLKVNDPWCSMDTRAPCTPPPPLPPPPPPPPPPPQGAPPIQPSPKSVSHAPFVRCPSSSDALRSRATWRVLWLPSLLAVVFGPCVLFTTCFLLGGIQPEVYAFLLAWAVHAPLTWSVCLLHGACWLHLLRLCFLVSSRVFSAALVQAQHLTCFAGYGAQHKVTSPFIEALFIMSKRGPSLLGLDVNTPRA